jgi:hypothetical protein
MIPTLFYLKSVCLLNKDLNLESMDTRNRQECEFFILKVSVDSMSFGQVW